MSRDTQSSRSVLAEVRFLSTGGDAIRARLFRDGTWWCNDGLVAEMLAGWYTPDPSPARGQFGYLEAQAVADRFGGRLEWLAGDVKGEDAGEVF